MIKFRERFLWVYTIKNIDKSDTDCFMISLSLLFELLLIQTLLLFTYLLPPSYRSERTMDTNNETLNKASLDTPFREPISPEIYAYIELVFNMAVNPTLGLAGIVLNIINMTVFYKMGLADGVTQNFFILALADGLLATTSLVKQIAYMVRTVIRAYLGYGKIEQIVHIIYQASFYSFPFPQNYSLITTVVIAVVRCCCVAMPLKVKHLLTVRRQLVAILFLSGIATSVFVYVMAPLRIFYVPYPAKNSTIAYFRGARWSTYTVFNSTVSFGGFIICITCVIILSTSLSKASKFRDSSTTVPSTSEKSGNTSGLDKKSRERQRNTRVVRTVLLVCLIFIVCNVPNMTIFVLKEAFEGFGPGGKYELSNLTTINVAEMFLLMSSCFNTFIYIFFNSRYHSTLLTELGKKLKATED